MKGRLLRRGEGIESGIAAVAFELLLLDFNLFVADAAAVESTINGCWIK